MRKITRLQVPKRGARVAKIRSFGQGVNTLLDASILPIGTAELVYNYSFNSGVLRQGYGIEYSDIIKKQPVSGQQIVAVWGYFKREPEALERLMLSTKSGFVYYKDMQSNNWTLLEGIRLTSRPNAVTYRLYGEDVNIITSPTDGMWVWDGITSIRYIDDVPLISSMTIHFERMFVTTADHPDAVWFSEDLDPTNFNTDIDAGGFIELIDDRGAPQTAISYLNFVYIFREFGITRLSAYGNQEEFGASNLFVSSGRIYPRTVVLCGDTIMLLASDGLYAFDGMSTRRIINNVTNIIVDSPHASAVFFEGKYYLSLRMQFDDGRIVGCEQSDFVNNALLVLDMTNGSYSISRGIDIAHMQNILGQVVCVTQDGNTGQIVECGAIFDQALLKVWRIGMSDLEDAANIKNIRELYINTKYNMQLLIRTDKGEQAIHVQGMDTIQRVRINKLCKLFGMDIISQNKEAHISRPQIRITS